MFLVVAAILGVMLAIAERDPRRRRFLNFYAAFSLGFLILDLAFQFVGLEQTIAFMTTFALFAIALVIVFGLQRVRRTT